MRSVPHAIVAFLLATMAVSSCECKKDPAPTEDPVFPERKVGFHVDKLIPSPKAQLDPHEREAPEVAAEPTAEIPGLPDDFPSEVPLFEGSTLSQVQGLANDAKNVVLVTEAPVSQVYRFYHDEMTGKGWHITQDFERDSHAFTTFKKGDLLMNLTIAEDGNNPGKKIIAIMYEYMQPLPFDEF